MSVNRTPKNDDEKIIFSTLNEIDEIAHLNGIYCFIVGGFCREEYLKNKHSISSDIDLMAENYNGLILAGFLGSHFKKKVEYSKKSGTAKLHINNIKFDCKANLKDYDILPLLRETNLPQNNLSFDLISRDFTINTLAIGLRSWHMYDILGCAKKHLNQKILVTPIEPNFSIQTNPIVFMRALKFNIRDNYKISPELDEAMLNNVDSIKALPIEDVRENLIEFKTFNANKAEKLYKKYGIEGFLS